MRRRQLLSRLAAFAAVPWLPARALAATETVGAARPFDYAGLKTEARTRAGRLYQTPSTTLPRAVQALDPEIFQSIRFRPEQSLWATDRLRFQARFIHLGGAYRVPVRMYEVVDGQAREIAYLPEMFDLGRSALARARLPRDTGFAGLRLTHHTDWERDVVVFQGASYFRAAGGDPRFGLSARGLAVDSGLPRPEEFPTFTAFWLERPAAGSSTLTLYALLDSPSVTGAYRFVVTPGETLTMEVDATLYPRKAIERLGIAPATSMFLHGENDRRMAYDWRPELHDSDGLAMWTGAGEWIWRPLSNPAQLQFNAFQDDNPRGFGLLQRDRSFDSYQDDDSAYERRPGLWIEPKGDWGKGSVQLVEIPTLDEAFDNIVAFWNPERRPQAGDELNVAYRLYWGAQPPVQSSLARVVATRTGLGGTPAKARKAWSWRFAVDFTGGPLTLLGVKSKVEAIVTTRRADASGCIGACAAVIAGCPRDVRRGADGHHRAHRPAALSRDQWPGAERNVAVPVGATAGIGGAQADLALGDCRPRGRGVTPPATATRRRRARPPSPDAGSRTRRHRRPSPRLRAAACCSSSSSPCRRRPRR